MRQANSMGFRYKAKKVAISVESPRPAMLRNFDSILVVTIEQLVGDFA